MAVRAIAPKPHVARPEGRWLVRPNIHHEHLALALGDVEHAGYVVFAILPAGTAGTGSYATIVGRKGDG